MKLNNVKSEPSGELKFFFTVTRHAFPKQGKGREGGGVGEGSKIKSNPFTSASQLVAINNQWSLLI